MYSLILFLIFMNFIFFAIYIRHEWRRNAKRILPLANIFKHTRDGIIITDNNTKIININDAFLSMTGFKRDELIGKTPRQLNSGWNDEKYYSDMWEAILTQGYWEGEIWDRKKDGTLCGQWLHINSVKDKNNNVMNYVWIATELTENKMASEQLLKLAYYDTLTGLPNRSLFMDRLSQAIAEAKRLNKMIALLYIDFDNFKQINDSFGHVIGDKFLQLASNLLTSRLREVDTIARLGGDKFAIILKNISNSITPIYVAKKLIDVFSLNHIIEQHEVRSTVSVGIALYHQNIENMNALIKFADQALYQAKEKGKNTFHLYESQSAAPLDDRSSIECRLRNAISKEELYVYYQPQVDIVNHEVIGLEALIRWQNADLGFISPDKFISIAEESHLIIDLTDWVITTACTQLKHFQQSGYTNLKLSLNMSSNYIRQKNINDHVMGIIANIGIDPKLLDFEITETAFFTNIEDSIEKLKIFKQHGITISVDDFGTGYSSMNYLRKFPIDKLKIDKSFIEHIPNNASETEITSAIIALAQALNLEVIAEGVETEEQLNFLIKKRCQFIQGYFFSRPLKADDVIAYLESMKLEHNNMHLEMEFHPLAQAMNNN